MTSHPDILNQLIDVLNDRKNNPTEKSYTASLFAKGSPKICEKISEEANEVIEAAGESGADARSHLIHEIADLWFHTMVLMVHKEMTLDDIQAELARRFGISGLEEKASRQ